MARALLAEGCVFAAAAWRLSRSRCLWRCLLRTQPRLQTSSTSTRPAAAMKTPPGYASSPIALPPDSVTDDNDDTRLQCPSCPLTVWPWHRQCSCHFTIRLMYNSSGLISAKLLQAVCFMDCFYSAAEGMFITSGPCLRHHEGSWHHMIRSSLKLPEHVQCSYILSGMGYCQCQALCCPTSARKGGLQRSHCHSACIAVTAASLQPSCMPELLYGAQSRALLAGSMERAPVWVEALQAALKELPEEEKLSEPQKVSL